jgi:hypothetical protein
MVFSTIINQGVSSEAVEAPQTWGWAIESANILNMLDVSLEGLEVWILPPAPNAPCFRGLWVSSQSIRLQHVDNMVRSKQFINFNIHFTT